MIWDFVLLTPMRNVPTAFNQIRSNKNKFKCICKKTLKFWQHSLGALGATPVNAKVPVIDCRVRYFVYLRSQADDNVSQYVHAELNLLLE